jgi:hypothetical protein
VLVDHGGKAAASYPEFSSALVGAASSRDHYTAGRRSKIISPTDLKVMTTPAIKSISSFA